MNEKVVGKGREKMSGGSSDKIKYILSVPCLRTMVNLWITIKFILEPDVLAVTHVAPINSSRLSVSLLAP